MDGGSLIGFLEAPVVVGDPEGRIVYVNPAFERSFCPRGEPALGEQMATLFEGGGREALLSAVAEVCAKGESCRFRMREDGRGYLGLASPIQADADAVGVVVLLTDEPALDRRLLTVHREIHEPLEDAIQCLDQLIDQTGGRRDERFREAVERGLGELGRARKWSLELSALLKGRRDGALSDGRLDAVHVVRQIADRVAPHFERAAVTLDLLVPAQLPAARGDSDQLETALVRLLRLRLAKAPEGSSFTLAARALGPAADQGVLVTVVDPRRSSPGDEDAEEREPQSLCEAIERFGGRVHTVNVPDAGRATAVRLELAS